MKLSEIKTYGEPKGDVRWDIDHPKYKKYPELQDAIWDGFKALPKVIQDKILQRYKLENISLIHFLPQQKLYDLLHDVEYFGVHGVGALPGSEPGASDVTMSTYKLPPSTGGVIAKQAGYNVGDEAKYPATGVFSKRQA